MGIALWLVPKSSSGFHESTSALILSLQTLFDDSPIFEPHITITSDISVNSTQDISNVLSAALAAINSISQLGDTQQPLLEFSKLQFGKKYFQKVYLEAVPSNNLISFARVIREFFVETPMLQLRASTGGAAILAATAAAGRNRSVSVSSINSATVSKNTFEEPVSPEDVPRLAEARAEDWSLKEFKPHLSLVYSNTYSINVALQRTIRSRVEDLTDVGVEDDGSLRDLNEVLSWPSEGSLKLVRCEGSVKNWEVLGSVDYRL